MSESSSKNQNAEHFQPIAVTAFEGVVSRGKIPDVGKTVRFLPEHCMMQKVHSGAVVHSEGGRLRIEGVDLEVW